MIMRGSFPSSEWIARSLDLRFRAAPGPGELPALTSTQQVVWTPPGVVEVQQVAIYEKASDPLVPAGGASTLSVGINSPFNGDRNCFVDAMNLANLAAGYIGQNTTFWAPRAPRGGRALLVPQGSADGTSPAGTQGDGIAMLLDTGSVTGTLFLDFQWRRL